MSGITKHMPCNVSKIMKLAPLPASFDHYF